MKYITKRQTMIVIKHKMTKYSHTVGPNFKPVRHVGFS